jgi:hypothetical protein
MHFSLDIARVQVLPASAQEETRRGIPSTLQNVAFCCGVPIPLPHLLDKCFPVRFMFFFP